MKINISKIIGFISLLLLFEPNLFVKYNTINKLYILFAIFFFVFYLLKAVKRSKITNITKWLIIYRVLALMTTIAFEGDILKCGYYSVVSISVFLAGEDYYYNNAIDHFIKNLNLIFFLFLTINILLYYKYPFGIITGFHFLGIRTRFTEYCFASLMALILNCKYNLEKKHMIFIQLLVIALNIIVPSISSAIVGFIAIILCYIALIVIRKLSKLKRFNYNVILYVAIAFYILVVFFRIQYVFERFITYYLNKSLTLTYRTIIWDNSFSLIFDKWLLIGHGMPIDGNFVPFYSSLWQAHSQILQSLYETGIIGTIIYFYLYHIVLIKASFHNSNSNSSTILCVSTIFGLFVSMTTEILGYYVPTYAILCLMYFAFLGERKEKNAVINNSSGL